MKIRDTHKQTEDIYFSPVLTLNIKTQNICGGSGRSVTVPNQTYRALVVKHCMASAMNQSPISATFLERSLAPIWQTFLRGQNIHAESFKWFHLTHQGMQQVSHSSFSTSAAISTMTVLRVTTLLFFS